MKYILPISPNLLNPNLIFQHLPTKMQWDPPHFGWRKASGNLSPLLNTNDIVHGAPQKHQHMAGHHTRYNGVNDEVLEGQWLLWVEWSQEAAGFKNLPRFQGLRRSNFVSFQKIQKTFCKFPFFLLINKKSPVYKTTEEVHQEFDLLVWSRNRLRSDSGTALHPVWRWNDVPFSAEMMHLVGGFNPFEKYARQIGSFPQGSGWK